MANSRSQRARLMQQCGFGPEVMRRTKVCKVCGSSIGADAFYCKSCGAVLPRETLFDFYRSQHLSCPACDTVVAKNTRFCPRCGQRLWQRDTSPASACPELPLARMEKPKEPGRLRRFWSRLWGRKPPLSSGH